MAFIVEDGTGLANASAYISTAYADAYFLDRANTAWVASTLAKQGAIVKATDYIEIRWGSRFIGRPLTTTQMLSFPRIGVPYSTGQDVPEKVKRATCEYAVRALTASLMPDPAITDSGLAVANKREKVGPLEEETQYQAGGVVTLLRPYPTADRLLAEYVTALGSNYR